MTASPENSALLYDLRLRPLWSAFKDEGLAFWLLCAYLMFEYVRPQSLYPSINFFPWTTATMAATAVALFVGRRSTRVASPANGLLVLYSFVLLLSSIGAYQPTESFSHLNIFLLWVAAYVLIIQIVTTERRMLLLLLAYVLFNLKMSQFATRSWMSIGFGFRGSGTGGAPGWFANSGEFGIEMCVFFPIVSYLALGLRPYLPRWKFLTLLGIAGTALMGIVASSSRGAALGVTVVAIFMWARSRSKARTLVIAVVVGTAFVLAIPPQSMRRMSASGDDATSQLRLTYWKHAIEMTNDHPLLGIGFWNWNVYHPAHYTGRVDQEIHNSVLQAASELGYSGLVAFLLLNACVFTLNARSRALATRAGPRGRLTYHVAIGLDGALIGFLVSGFFISALYYPFFWINLAFTVALNTVAKGLPSGPPVRQPARIGERLEIAARPGYVLGNSSLPPEMSR